MFERIRQHLLRWVRVPDQPEPPTGAPDSIRVFRAGRNYYKLRLLRWGIGQIGAAIGIMVSLYFIDQLELGVTDIRTTIQKTGQEQMTPASDSAAPAATAPEVNKPAKLAKLKAQDRRQRSFVRIAAGWPEWIFPLLHLLEYGAIGFLIVQLPFTYAAVRLEFEQHWYIVTDRSLRIRTGLFRLTESTMSFANLQQVEVKQGPLQRLLGLADVRVQSAGGGGEQHDHHAGDSLHTCVFHSVEHAPEIRDLILLRLRQFRAAGLGDPDDPNLSSAQAVTSSAPTDALAAARGLLAEAQALRQTLSAGKSASV